MMPKISIVTPTLNQGRYIEETILSVLGQNYPNLEYIVIDGGSTDETVEIINKYEKYLHYWVSEKDNGQSHAINKAFKIATGDILGWLNSDDMYLPGTLNYVADTLRIDSNEIVFGNCIHFRVQGSTVIASGSDVSNAQMLRGIDVFDYVIQPSSFWPATVWETVGELREDLHYTFDWEWFIRAERKGIALRSVEKPLSIYRFHEEHKTSTGSDKRASELLAVYEIYNPENAALCKKLIQEDFTLDILSGKALFSILKKLNRPRSFGDILKIARGKKYSRYSVAVINDIKKMLK